MVLAYYLCGTHTDATRVHAGRYMDITPQSYRRRELLSETIGSIGFEQ